MPHSSFRPYISNEIAHINSPTQNPQKCNGHFGEQDKIYFAYQQLTRNTRTNNLEWRTFLKITPGTTNWANKFLFLESTVSWISCQIRTWCKQNRVSQINIVCSVVLWFVIIGKWHRESGKQIYIFVINWRKICWQVNDDVV